jgi:hypothetical protein
LLLVLQDNTIIITICLIHFWLLTIFASVCAQQLVTMHVPGDLLH